MSRHNTVAYAAILLVFAFSSAVAQTSVALSAGVVKAKVDIDELTELLEKTEGAANDAFAGRTPTVSGKFSGIASSFQDAAARLQAAPLPTDYIPTHPVKAAEVANCSTREAARQTLRNDLAALRASQKAGNESLKLLDDAGKDVERSRKALDYLMSVYGKLMQLPIYGDLFAFDWLELNTSVSNSLATLHDAVSAKKKKLSANMDWLNIQVSNFQTNMDEINGIPPCSART